MDEKYLEALFTLHRGLPREGPGSDNCTREALRRLPHIPPDAVIYDLGCGPGRQSLVLASELKAPVIAVDLHPPFLEQLKQSAECEGLSSWIDPRLGDFATLPVSPGSVDLIWSEGAAYILGFEESLRVWRPWLKPSGLVALTECTWLSPNPPTAVKNFWNAGYPSMGTESENRLRAERSGYRVLETFVLPDSAWWDEYYTPLIARINLLRADADWELAKVIEETEHEISMFRHFSHYYSYTFYIMQIEAFQGKG